MFFKGNNRYLPICVKCIDYFEKQYTEILGSSDMAIQRLCLHWDIYYNRSLLEASKKINIDHSRISGYISKSQLQQYKDKTYDTYLQELTELPTQSASEAAGAEESWDESEQKNKRYAVEVVGYDPFSGYPDTDRKFLFNELVKYFDDDISQDTYKLSQVIQVVNNNNQIRRYDVLISAMNPITDANNIRQLNNLKKDLVANNDKIAKENEISVKNRSNKDVGKSTLTYLMRDLREKDFEKAEADYYNQLRSRGTFWAVEMSEKAIQNNGMFDENDKREIFNIQRELIKKLQGELDGEREKTRLLNRQISDLSSRISGADGDET